MRIEGKYKFVGSLVCYSDYKKLASGEQVLTSIFCIDVRDAVEMLYDADGKTLNVIYKSGKESTTYNVSEEDARVIITHRCADWSESY